MCDSGIFIEVEYFNLNESAVCYFFNRFKLAQV